MIMLSELMRVLKCPSCLSWQDWKVYPVGSSSQIKVLDALHCEVESCEIKNGSVEVRIKFR